MSQRFVMCRRKRAYSKSEAGDAARIQKQRAYNCPFCRNYHLTSKTLVLNLGHGVKVWV